MEEELTPGYYYLNLDEEGYLLSVALQTEGEGPYLESIDDYDFSGERLGAYRWDGEKLIFDPARYAERTAEAARENTQLLILELTARLRQSDSVILEALEGLLAATTLTGFLAALIEAARSIRETLTERAGIRERIRELMGVTR